MGKFMSKSKLKKILGDKYKDIENSAINYGLAFASNQTTKVVDKVAELTYMDTFTNFAVTGLGIYPNVANLHNMISKDDIENMTTNVASSLVSTLVENTTSYITSKVTSLMPSSKEFLSKTTSYYKKQVHDFSFYTKKYLVPLELDQQLDDTNMQNDMIAKKLNTIKKDIGMVSSYIKIANDWVNTYINSVFTYRENGPDWVSDQLDKLMTTTIEKEQQLISSAAKPIQKERDNMINDVSKWAGTALAHKTNKALDKAAKKTADLLNKTKSKLTTQASMSILSAKIKILSKIGLAGFSI